MPKEKILDSSLMLMPAAFEDCGGWVRDTQFILTMGGVYLLAHGLGRPVDDAKCVFKCLKSGDYHVYAYTFNWVAPWHEDMHPGQFEIHLAGQKTRVLGIRNRKWDWEYGGAAKRQGRGPQALHRQSHY